MLSGDISFHTGASPSMGKGDKGISSENGSQNPCGAEPTKYLQEPTSLASNAAEQQCSEPKPISKYSVDNTTEGKAEGSAVVSSDVIDKDREGFYLKCMEASLGINVVGKLGEGTFGKVYKALDSKGTMLACKVYVIRYGIKSRLFFENNRGDVSVLQLPEHKNIATMRHVVVGDCVEDSYFKVLNPSDKGVINDDSVSLFTAGAVSNFVEGETLKYHCERRTLAESELRTITLQTAKALRHMHHHGFVHRNLSETNILWSLVYGATVIDMDAARHSLERVDEDTDPYDGSDANDDKSQDVAEHTQVGKQDAVPLDCFDLGKVLFWCLTKNGLLNPTKNEYINPSVDPMCKMYRIAQMSDDEKLRLIENHSDRCAVRKSEDFLQLVIGLLAHPQKRLTVDEVISKLEEQGKLMKVLHE